MSQSHRENRHHACSELNCQGFNMKEIDTQPGELSLVVCADGRQNRALTGWSTSRHVSHVGVKEHEKMSRFQGDHERLIR
ncbi:hypothetical protein [Pistricoccus aurantiacus]|uniref:hypothetical protein n=1 Tax=Pistricoccus aurantiacus TaxID=1883414 RepID=UPI00363B1F17